jgi:hypothetical protein
MRILRVIPSRRWVNKRTGAQASIYGSTPWTNSADEGNWEIRESGWTWENSNGTIGLGRAPAKTQAEAVEVMRRENARLDDLKARYPAPTPVK